VNGSALFGKSAIAFFRGLCPKPGPHPEKNRGHSSFLTNVSFVGAAGFERQPGIIAGCEIAS